MVAAGAPVLTAGSWLRPSPEAAEREGPQLARRVPFPANVTGPVSAGTEPLTVLRAGKVRGTMNASELGHDQPNGATPHVVGPELMGVSRRLLAQPQDGLLETVTLHEPESLPRLKIDQWPGFMFGSTIRQPWVLPFTANSIRVSVRPLPEQPVCVLAATPCAKCGQTGAWWGEGGCRPVRLQTTHPVVT